MIMNRSFSALSNGSRYVEGVVVHGFNRGSTLLGAPTANLSSADVDALLTDLDSGIYFGWSRILRSSLASKDATQELPGSYLDVHPCVISVGYNPTFGDVKCKVFEVWILYDFLRPGSASDEAPWKFYGHSLGVSVEGRIRDELVFSDIRQLIDAIRGDRLYCLQMASKRPYLGC